MTYKGGGVSGAFSSKILDAKPAPLAQADVHFLDQLIRLHRFVSRILDSYPCPYAPYASHPRPGPRRWFIRPRPKRREAKDA